MLVDIDTSKIIDVIDSRDLEKVSGCLKKYTHVEVISRDGSITYSNAISNALGSVTQVSDRFHLLKNLTDYSKDYIKRIIKTNAIKISTSPEVQVNAIKSCVDVNLNLDVKQSEKGKNKNQLIQQAKELYLTGYSIRSISSEMCLDRKTVKKYIVLENEYVHASKGIKRSSNLNGFEKTITSLNNEKKKWSYIYKVISEDGYKGSESNLRKFLSEIKKENVISDGTITIERKYVISLLYNNDITRFKHVNTEHLRNYVDSNSDLQTLYSIIESFKKNLLKEKDESNLDLWINQVKRLDIPELNSFIVGIERDLVAVKNAIKLKYSNGLAEGTVNKIKVVKRIMYGRCSFELLRKKLLLL